MTGTGSLPESLASKAPAAAPALPMLWVNGRLVDPGAPHLLALDRGFTLADGVFETMRAYGGAIFRLDRHLARLTAGAQALGIPLPEPLDGLVATAMHAARAAGVRDASVRLTVSRGVGAPGLAPPEPAAPTVVLALHPVPPVPPTLYTHGLTAWIASGRRNERGATCGLKTLAYTESVVALAEARAAGADEAIVLDTAGHVSEAAASNIFLCMGDALHTPPCSCGALPGITREVVMALAPSLGVAVVEREIAERDLFAAEEAFLTSSLREIAPLVRVNGRPVSTGVVGPVTRRVMAAYAALTAKARMEETP